MRELLPCRQCGSPPNPIQFTGPKVWFGVSNLTAYISCSGKNNPYCPVELGTTSDTLSRHSCTNREKTLYLAWNLLNDISEIPNE